MREGPAPDPPPDAHPGPLLVGLGQPQAQGAQPVEEQRHDVGRLAHEPRLPPVRTVPVVPLGHHRGHDDAGERGTRGLARDELLTAAKEDSPPRLAAAPDLRMTTGPTRRPSPAAQERTACSTAITATPSAARPSRGSGSPCTVRAKASSCAVSDAASGWAPAAGRSRPRTAAQQPTLPVPPDPGPVPVPDVDQLLVRAVGRAPDAGPGRPEHQVELRPLGRHGGPAHPGHLGPRQPAGQIHQMRAQVEQRVVGGRVRAPAAPPVTDLQPQPDLGAGRDRRAQPGHRARRTAG